MLNCTNYKAVLQVLAISFVHLFSVLSLFGQNQTSETTTQQPPPTTASPKAVPVRNPGDKAAATKLATTAELPSPDKSASAEPLTIDEAMLEMLVITNNFDYKKAKINYSQSARSIQGVWNDFFPTISGVAQMGYKIDSLLLNSGNTGDQWKTNLGVTAEINLTAWVFFNILQTTADYNVGKITFESARKQILDTARKTFHNLILSKKLLELQESTVRLALANYRQAVSRYKSGLIQRVDMISTQVELENQKNEYEKQKTQYEKDVLGFKLIVGVPLDQIIILTGEITIDASFLDSNYLIANYLDVSPNVRLAQATVWSNRWNTYYQHFNIITPFAQVGYASSNPYSSFSSILPSDQWGDGAYATFGIKFQLDSLFPWSKNGLSLWKLRDNFIISKEDAKQSRIQAHIDIVNAVNTVNNTQNNIRSLRLAYNLSEENLSLIVKGYLSGVRDFVEVQQATQSRSTALSNYLRAQIDYYSALLDLSYLTNSDITEILEVAAIPAKS